MNPFLRGFCPTDADTSGLSVQEGRLQRRNAGHVYRPIGLNTRKSRETQYYTHYEQ